MIGDDSRRKELGWNAKIFRARERYVEIKVFYVDGERVCVVLNGRV